MPMADGGLRQSMHTETHCEPQILLGERRQLAAYIFGRFSRSHTAEFLGFLLVMRRSFFRGAPWEVHFPPICLLF